MRLDIDERTVGGASSARNRCCDRSETQQRVRNPLDSPLLVLRYLGRGIGIVHASADTDRPIPGQGTDSAPGETSSTAKTTSGVRTKRVSSQPP